MRAANKGADEQEREDFIRRLPLAAAGEVFEHVTALARQLFDAEAAYVTLIAEGRLWHSGAPGVPAGFAREGSRRPWQDNSLKTVQLCKAIWQADLHNEESDSPTARLFPHVRFYANTPIPLVSGVAIGTLCVASTRPRQYDENLALALKHLAALTAREAERITALKELAEARDAADEASRAKSAFLATMSHEIRTPLNGVLGMAQAMAAEKLPPLQEHRLAVLQQSGAVLLGVLNDILDLSKVEAGRLELEETIFELGDLAAAAQATYAELANRKGISLDFVVERRANGRYRGDPTRLRQVVFNLVSNAVKFTEKGGVGVEIDRFGGHLKIAVSDSGVGIPLDRRDAVFEAFSQAEASTTRRFGGTGLGLTIVRELVSLMGGSITVDSAEGVGSVFTVLVPMARVSRRKRPKPLAARQAATTRDGLKVLIAEDNEINRLVLTTLIGQLGASTVVTENGRQAVDAWASGGFDLVLMDVQMPVLDGLSATREIRSREAAAGRRRTPVIALTGDVMPHHLLEYEQHGMDACVAKPIIVGDLVDVLDRVLAESGAAESAA